MLTDFVIFFHNYLCMINLLAFDRGRLLSSFLL